MFVALSFFVPQNHPATLETLTDEYIAPVVATRGPTLNEFDEDLDEIISRAVVRSEIDGFDSNTTQTTVNVQVANVAPSTVCANRKLQRSFSLRIRGCRRLKRLSSRGYGCERRNMPRSTSASSQKIEYSIRSQDGACLLQARKIYMSALSSKVD